MSRKLLWWLCGVVALCLVGFLAAYFWVADWIYHPLGYCTGANCKGYQFWSGVEGALPQIAAIAVVLSAWRAAHNFLHTHFECHEETCHKLGFHRVLGTPYRTCWTHHPVLSQHEEEHAVSMNHLRNAHEAAMKRVV